MKLFTPRASSLVQVVLAVLILVAPAAAMTLTTSPSPPSASEILLGFDAPPDGGGYVCRHGTGTTIDIGQTFRLPRRATLDKITVAVRPVTEVAGEMMVLTLGTFTDPADAAMDELLRAETRPLPSELRPGEVLYLTLDIADMELEPARQYGFFLGFVGGGNVNDARLELLSLGRDAYPGGQAVEDVPGTATTALPADLGFFLHGAISAPDGSVLLLEGGRFEVRAGFATREGATGFGRPVALTGASGYFWFFSDDNVELLVKILDACDLDGHYWVFAAGMTDVEVILEVHDTASGERQLYGNAMGEPLEPILDTAAFATCGG